MSFQNSVVAASGIAPPRSSCGWPKLPLPREHDKLFDRCFYRARPRSERSAAAICMQRRYVACMAQSRLPQALRAKLRLRELILEGGLKRGERVSEVPLAGRLGVSRTPLRLALAQLE